MRQEPRYHLNAEGDFYVLDGMCMACAAPEHEAPELMAHDPDGLGHCYFKRQPATSQELQRATRAVSVGCCDAVRYGGTDPAVLAQLAAAGADNACDYCS